MTEEKLDELLHDAATSYNRPPDLLPLDDMWSTIERRAFTQRAVLDSRDDMHGSAWHRFRRSRTYRVLQAAALVVLGVGIGRMTVTQTTAADAVVAVESDVGVPYPYAPVTDRYLGQAAALLIDLPRELRDGDNDARFVAGASDLLLQTRLLLDSPAIEDPALRTLLEDLEVVLVQLVRLEADPDPLKVEMLEESLQHSDVIPRLRNAVADYITD
jgi:hypothetical protein